MKARRAGGFPTATDIAFAVGVCSLLGDRVPSGVKLFLLTVAIVGDIIAIAVYAFAGVAVWLAMHESGVHATLAGVALGLLTPARPVAGRRVLETLEHRLHPVSAFAVVPLFALANAGVDFGDGVLVDASENRLTWAIVAGLVLGKLLGIAGATFPGLRVGWGSLPHEVSQAQVWGVAALGGIGFTVAPFIAQIAYDDPHTVEMAKVGTFGGSLVSATAGALILGVIASRRAPEP